MVCVASAASDRAAFPATRSGASMRPCAHTATVQRGESRVIAGLVRADVEHVLVAMASTCNPRELPLHPANRH